ncbi:unnamed protein product [Linum trigynum]
MLIFCLLFSLSLSLATTENTLINQQCHHSETPLACRRCIESDPESESVSRPVDVAAILLKCLAAHSSNLAVNMTGLARLANNTEAQPIFEACSRQFDDMGQRLSTAGACLKRGDYDGANHGVARAVGSQATCLGLARGRVGEMPTQMYDMRMNDALSEAFLRIVDRL